MKVVPTAFRIFVCAFVTYILLWVVAYKTGINKLAIQSEDTLPAMFLPVTMIQDHALYLDKYYAMLISRYPQPDDKKQLLGYTPYYLQKVGGHYVSTFTIITPILALPVYLPALIAGVVPSWDNLILLSHLSSAFIVALSGAFMFKLLSKLSKYALLLTTVYLFGTVNMAMVSQSLWQHGAVQLFTVLALYFLVKDDKGCTKNVFFTGLFLALAILARPTAGLSAAAISIYILMKNKRLVPAFVLGAVLPAVFFLISSSGIQGQTLNHWRFAFPEAFLGMWLSPSKGILVYSPVFIFSIVGAYLACKKHQYFYMVSAVIVFLHTLIISFWEQWYGGYSFGYRLTSDVIPFLVLLLVPFVELEKHFKLFIFSVVLSVFVEICGMFFFDGVWHAAYDRGFKNQAWLWSVKDSEAAFNVRRVLVKAHLLERACPQCL